MLVSSTHAERILKSYTILRTLYTRVQNLIRENKTSGAWPEVFALKIFSARQK
jgi:hypothetical protein